LGENSRERYLLSFLVLPGVSTKVSREEVFSAIMLHFLHRLRLLQAHQLYGIILVPKSPIPGTPRRLDHKAHAKIPKKQSTGFYGLETVGITDRCLLENRLAWVTCSFALRGPGTKRRRDRSTLQIQESGK
jgi:hypothetical protein